MPVNSSLAYKLCWLLLTASWCLFLSSMFIQQFLLTIVYAPIYNQKMNNSTNLDFGNLTFTPCNQVIIKFGSPNWILYGNIVEPLILLAVLIILSYLFFVMIFGPITRNNILFTDIFAKCLTTFYYFHIMAVTITMDDNTKCFSFNVNDGYISMISSACVTVILMFL